MQAALAACPACVNKQTKQAVILLQATDPSEKERNLVALTYARQADLRQQTLEMVLQPSVRSQDALTLLSGVALRSNAAAHAAWSFLQQ